MPFRDDKVRFAAAETDTTVSWLAEIDPAFTRHQEASVVIEGCVDEVTVKEASPPKRSKDSLSVSADSFTGGASCVTEIIRLCLLPLTRIEVLRGSVPVWAWAVTDSLKVLFDKATE